MLFWQGELNVPVGLLGNRSATLKVFPHFTRVNNHRSGQRRLDSLNKLFCRVAASVEESLAHNEYALGLRHVLSIEQFLKLVRCHDLSSPELLSLGDFDFSIRFELHNFLGALVPSFSGIHFLIQLALVLENHVLAYFRKLSHLKAPNSLDTVLSVEVLISLIKKATFLSVALY